MPSDHPNAKVRTQVYLARHGQTAYNLEGRFQGQQQIPLDETGLAQAEELGRRAAAHGFAALWSSPLRRARETADAVARHTRLTVREDARLMETDAGDWTDRWFAEVQSESPRAFAAFLAGDPAFAFPGGESFAEQERRVAAALQAVEQGELPALIVCHGMVIRAALSVRAHHWLSGSERVPNGALIPLDPVEAFASAEAAGGAATTPS